MPYKYLRRERAQATGRMMRAEPVAKLKRAAVTRPAVGTGVTVGAVAFIPYPVTYWHHSGTDRQSIGLWSNFATHRARNTLAKWLMDLHIHGG